MPNFIGDILKKIHPEVLSPLKSLVGPNGYVVGVDMTEKQVSFVIQETKNNNNNFNSVECSKKFY